MTLDLNTIIMVLLIAGAINWGTVGFNGTDLVSKLGDKLGFPTYERYVKLIIGVAGLYALYQFASHRL